jgi:ParB family chromosome partitioning protein
MSKIQQKNRPRLGRGLSSLVSVSELPVEVDVSTAVLPESPPNVEAISASPVIVRDGLPLEIPISQISANPHQPRKQMDEASVAELAASIQSTGLIQPIVVRPVDGAYQLIAGERRWRAARIAGLEKIPALVRDVDSFTQALMALVENIQRRDLNPIERAQAYRELIDQMGLTQAELAGRLGEDRSSIANLLRLLELAEPVKAMVSDGRLSVGHAKLIASVPDILEQQRLADLVVSQGLSVRNLERLMAEGTPAKPTRETPAPSAHIADLERSLTRQLGMRVQVRTSSKKGKGRLVIHYASLDQFDELIGRLGLHPE